MDCLFNVAQHPIRLTPSGFIANLATGPVDALRASDPASTTLTIALSVEGHRRLPKRLLLSSSRLNTPRRTSRCQSLHIRAVHQLDVHLEVRAMAFEAKHRKARA